LPGTELFVKDTGGDGPPADIATSNFVVYQYLGFEIDAGQYPKLAKYLRDMLATAAFQRALADERPFADQMGLKRDFLAMAA
jgi:glutathione S-transferase